MATGDFATNVGELASSDVGRQLSQSLSGLVEVERRAQDLQTQQAEQDITTLTSTADEYARLINSVRVSLFTLSFQSGVFGLKSDVLDGVRVEDSRVPCMEICRSGIGANQAEPREESRSRKSAN